ncbi:MAG: hypothetical protein P4L71_20495 [Acetobacteraceae bacterium]|nr:hypothetical protein [Acetobacteraceae bacterium]
MPFDGTAFVAAPPVAGGTPPKPGYHGPWQRVVAAVARLLQPARLRGFDLPLPQAPTREAAHALQTLALARSLIADEQAWVQRRYETRDGRRCAVGALRGAARLLHNSVPHGDAVSSLLAVAMSRGFTDIETMNDHSTHTQVVRAFDEAMFRVRQAGE